MTRTPPLIWEASYAKMVVPMLASRIASPRQKMVSSDWGLLGVQQHYIPEEQNWSYITLLYGSECWRTTEVVLKHASHSTKHSENILAKTNPNMQLLRFIHWQDILTIFWTTYSLQDGDGSAMSYEIKWHYLHTSTKMDTCTKKENVDDHKKTVSKNSNNYIWDGSRQRSKLLHNVDLIQFMNISDDLVYKLYHNSYHVDYETMIYWFCNE